MKNITKMLYVCVLSIFVLMPLVVLGQTIDNPNVPPGGEFTFAEIQRLLQRISDWVLIAAMIIAVIVIVWGGIQYMFSSDKTDAAKSRIYNGIIGAAVVLAVGIILRTVAALLNRSFFFS